MKKVVTLILILISANLYGQTKNETQEWIKDKIELYSFSDDIEIFYEYHVQFSNGNIVITYKLKSRIGGVDGNFVTTYWIPIKELTKIRFEENQDNVWLYLKIKDGNKSIMSKTDFENTHNYRSEVYIILEKDMTKDNLIPRMTKAFDHLIQLYGGKPTKEIF